MRPSVGVLYDCQRFLHLCSVNTFALYDVEQSFRQRFGLAAMADVLNMVRNMGWISYDDQSALIVTARGLAIRSAESVEAALRMQLDDYIRIARPAWSALVPRGRVEAMAYFPSDIKQCFREAGLAEGYDESVVAFWDSIAAQSRGRSSDTMLKIGRTGERLSVDHETKRTGRTPEWKAIDSNSVGYDILSVVSRSDATPLRIEVKTTTQHRDPAFFISKNEWDVAQTGNYVFHLWVVDSVPTLSVRYPAEVAPHIPHDRGAGEWQTTRVLFAEGSPSTNLLASDS